MEMPSSMAVLLQGYDTWVLEAKPLCDDARKVLCSLQRAATQLQRGRDPISSIPVLLRSERYGRSVGGGFTLASLPTDALLF